MDRLDKVISSQTEYSRGDVKKLLKLGVITVNGEVVNKPNIYVDANNDIICVDDMKIDYKKYVYLVLNKPKGYISATCDGNYPVVVELVPYEYQNRNIFPCGRLDKDTTGLMILSDDGDFSHNLLSPKKHVSKKYLVEVDKDLDDSLIDSFKEGIQLKDFTCKSSLLEIIDNRHCYVTLTEGKYHQIKRMFKYFGIEVINLKRISMGKLELPKDLEEGECRELTKEEFDSLFE